MSSSASKAVVQTGKVVVRVAENGHSYELECDECTLVESMQKTLESVFRIPFNDQLLLCLNMKLESQRPLSAYKLPSDDREVFLFNKARMRNTSPPPALEQVEIIDIPDPSSPDSSQNPHPLDDAPDPALKALPSYERQIIPFLTAANMLFFLPKHSKKYSDSSSSSSSESSSSDDEERESKRSRSRLKRRHKEKKKRSKSKHSSSENKEADGPLPLSRFFGAAKS